MTKELVFETVLDAPPEKVWRALAIPEYLERWLQRPANAELSIHASDENRSLTYLWREVDEASPACRQSLVTFELAPGPDGGTLFRLTHAPVVMPAAANGNSFQAVKLAA